MKSIMKVGMKLVSGAVGFVCPPERILSDLCECRNCEEGMRQLYARQGRVRG